MRDPMAIVAAFLLGLILADAWHRQELRQAQAQRDEYRRAFEALAGSIEAEGARMEALQRGQAARWQR